MIRDIIVRYWIEVSLGCICGVIGMWCKSLHCKIKAKQDEQDAIKIGMIAMLHDRLFDICNKYLELGYIPVDEAEEVLDRAKLLYEAYHGLGGNGTGTRIYERFTGLKIK